LEFIFNILLSESFLVQTASSALHSIGTGESNILPFICPLDFVSFSFHEDDEILFALTFLHGIADIVHQPEFPALPLLRCPPFSGGHLLATALVLGQGTEAMSHTDIIADQPKKLQSVGVLPEFQSSLEVYGVDDEVTVYMVGIAVGGNENFRTGPGTGGKLHGDLMRLLGSDILRGFEGLYILIEVYAIHFSMSCLGCFELQNGIHTVAVDAADEPLAGLLVPGFILSHTVPHDTSHGADVLPGFLDVGHGCHGAPRLILYNSA
jgi:hypothetical protein